MIPQELFKRNPEDWSPFMEKLERTVRRKKRARTLRRAAIGIAAALAVTFMIVTRQNPEEGFLSARIPLRNSPTITVEGGYAVEKGSGVWLVCDSGVRK